jgi:hypothetical protein
MNGAAMNKYFQVLPLCFTVLGFGIGVAHAQTTPATGDQSTTGASTMGHHKAHVHRMARKKAKHHRMAAGKLKGEEYRTEAAAKAHCPTQTVVWVNTYGHVFHLPRSKYYGKTKHGAFVCEKAAQTAGFRASKY